MMASCPMSDNAAHDVAVTPALHTRKTALVVAHPDDEALWLSAFAGTANRIVFCYGDVFERPRMSAARRKAVSALAEPPLVNLAIAESGAGFSVDWKNSQPTPFGIAIRDAAARARYEANYARLVELLRPALAGFDDIYTHNPWGEYGHAEHIQVYRAVAALQAELGYTIWVTNYVSDASWALAQRLKRDHLWTQRRTIEPDVQTARNRMRIYQSCGAWTWTRAHRWPKQECVYAIQAQRNSQTAHPFEDELLLDVAGLRWWPPPWRAALRRLR